MSSTNIQREEITTLLEVIAEQTDTVLTFEDGQIPQIELDLVRESIRKLYTNYMVLDKLNSKLVDRLTDSIIAHDYPAEEKTIVEIIPEPIKEVVVLVEPVIEILETTPESASQNIEPQVVESKTIESFIEPILEPKPHEKQPEPLSISVEPEVPVEKSAPVVSAPVAEVVKAEPKAVKPSKVSTTTGNLFSNSASVADQFKDEKQSLHEKMVSPGMEISFAEKLQQKPITDLVRSIGINEKFLFIRELFKNQGEDYNEAIQLLNNFSSIAQAFDYMDILKQKYQWNEASDASLKLYDMIRRKYQK